MYFESNGHKLFYREWVVATPSKLVVIAHGLGEHSGRYTHVAKVLNAAGYSVFALDHQGHGESEGQRGHVMSFEDYHADLHQFISRIKVKYPDLELHLLGHSMGAMIATGYALRFRDIESLILSAPPYGVPGKSANFQLKVGAFLGKFLPTIELSNQIDPTSVCKNKKVVEQYIADELVHDKISLGWGTGFVKEQTYILNNLAQLTVPYLLLLAQQDLLTDYSVAEKVFPSVGSDKKKLVVYPNAYHELLNEVEEGEQALQEIIQWLQ